MPKRKRLLLFMSSVRLAVKHPGNARFRSGPMARTRGKVVAPGRAGSNPACGTKEPSRERQGLPTGQPGTAGDIINTNMIDYGRECCFFETVWAGDVHCGSWEQRQAQGHLPEVPADGAGGVHGGAVRGTCADGRAERVFLHPPDAEGEAGRQA